MIDEHHHYHRVQIATGNGRGACGCEQVRSVAVEGGGRVRRMDCAARALAQLLQGYFTTVTGLSCTSEQCAGGEFRADTLHAYVVLSECK